MSLRQEYVKNKISLHEARKEEVKDWLNENVVFINERMDRARVKRLINLMLKFDQKFGPFKDKIPGITSIVADAENALQMALSGRLSNAKIGDIFQRLSIIYSILSDFFANDLKVLLQTPAFKVPRTKPEVRLDSITDSGYSPKHITDTLVLTLSPSEEEMVFLNKLYKGITLPQLDRHSIANQMLGLSYKDLEGLCGMEQVPMAVIPDENLLNEAGFWANLLGGKEIDLKLLKKINALKALIPTVTNPELKQRLQTFVNDAGKVDQKLDGAAKIGPKELATIQQIDLIIGAFKKLANDAGLKKATAEIAKSDEEELSDAEKNAFSAALKTALPDNWRLGGFKTTPPPGLTNKDIRNAIFDSIGDDASQALEEKSLKKNKLNKKKLFENRKELLGFFKDLTATIAKAPTPDAKETAKVTAAASGAAPAAAGTGGQAAKDNKATEMAIDQIINRAAANQAITADIRNKALSSASFAGLIMQLSKTNDPFIKDQINQLNGDIKNLGFNNITDINKAGSTIQAIASNPLMQQPEKLNDLNKLTIEEFEQLNKLNNLFKTNGLTGTLPENLNKISKLFAFGANLEPIYDQLKARVDKLLAQAKPAAAPAAPAAPPAAPATGGGKV